MGYRYNWSVLLEPPYLDLLLKGTVTTLELAAISTVASFAGGGLMAIGRSSQVRWCRVSSEIACDIMRSVPGVFLLLFWFMFVPAVIPPSLGATFNGWAGYAFLSAVLGLVFNNTPYIADILYSAISTTDRDVVASARIAGLRGMRFWCSVMLPGAVMSSIPALGARFVHNLKNTSLAMVISVHDLTWSAQEVESLTFAGLEVTSVCTLIYAAMAIVFSALFYGIERHAASRRRLSR